MSRPFSWCTPLLSAPENLYCSVQVDVGQRRHRCHHGVRRATVGRSQMSTGRSLRHFAHRGRSPLRCPACSRPSVRAELLRRGQDHRHLAVDHLVRRSTRAGTISFPGRDRAAEIRCRPCTEVQVPPEKLVAPERVAARLRLSTARSRVISGEDQGGDADAVASWVGVPVEQLRRQFEEEVGTGLDQVIRNGRLDFARKLVVETSLPLATIADIAAFPTMREFSEAFESRFRRPPDAGQAQQARR